MNLTKFSPPRSAHILVRERLVNKLQSWEDKKIVIIHAQAGQGKSTLAADYLRTIRYPAIWYNMDREDDNPMVFLTNLGHAVQRLFPQIIQKLPPIPLYRLGIGNPFQGITRWIDHLLGGVKTPLLVVFDDFNYTSPSQELRSIMTLLIECTPHDIRFLLLSRSRPDIELARLRAKQVVGEITGMDLKFSEAETHELFSSVLGLLVSKNESDVINRVTEGWPAGLVLMHEYLAGASEAERKKALTPDKGFETFREHVFDYLAQEVFSHLSPNLQRFLLRTSITDDLPVDLLEQLSRPSGAKKKVGDLVREIIEELRRKNLFITVVDDGEPVIQYHALFREFLNRKFIAITDPAEVTSLYSLAASYFKSRGDFVRMVNLLIFSGQFEKAVRQIESRGLELIARGQIQTLLKWVQLLPLEWGNRPWMLFYRAIDFRFSDANSALKFFDLAYARFRSTRSSRDRALGQMHSLCGLIEASFYARGDLKRMASAAASAEALLKKQKAAGEAAGRLALAIGMAYFVGGRLRKSADYLERSLRTFQEEGDHYYQIQSASYLAVCTSYLGDFAASRRSLRKGMEAVHHIPHEPGGDAGLNMAHAMTSLFEGNFVEAQESVDRCINLSQTHDLTAMNLLSLDICGWLKIATSNYEAAESLLIKCKNKGQEHENAFFTASGAHLLGVLYLHQGRLSHAQEEAESALTIRARSGSKLFHAASLALCGRIDVKRGKIDRGERRLWEARRMSRACEALQQEANVLLALAEINIGKKKETLAKKFLLEGLRIGMRTGFTYYYLYSPEELAILVRTALHFGIEKHYCMTLLNKYDQPESVPRLEIRTFGGFAVFRNGDMIKNSEWKGKQARILLKRLVAERGHFAPRDVIMDMLWPEASPQAQQTNIASLLYRMRRFFGPPGVAGGEESCIVTDGDRIGLNVLSVRTDVDQFLTCLGRAKHLKSDEPGRSIEEYEKALRIYCGDFLPDDLYEDWAAASRAWLRRQYVDALQNMAAAAESAGNSAKAAEAYATQFDDDECNEEACRKLMSYYLACGKKNEALRTYERCQLALSRDLGTEPDGPTKNLYRSLIGG